jgi:3-hydroxyisobutyrate dehydrogenase
MKAFLGMGLLGSNFVKAMINKGEEVHVWNRTSSRAFELEKFGAKAFEIVKDAVKGASLVHLTLKDDASVDEVLEAASEGLEAGTIIIDHTTTSKEGAIRRTKEWKERGFIYQHAPVFMGPANAFEGTGFILLSGDQEIIGKIEPELSKMTGKILHFGAEVGKAAAIKLVGNSYLVCFAAGLREMLSVAKALEVGAEDIFTLLGSWNPGAQVQTRLKRMTSGDSTDPSWELAMSRKDTQLFLDTAQQAGVNLTIMPVIAALMDQYISQGYGHHDWTVIAKDVL